MRDTGHHDAGSRRRIRADAKHRSMRRRLLIAIGASACGISLTTVAQTQKVQRIGILFANSKSNPSLQAFLQELRTLGYIDGQNAAIVFRIADGNSERLPALATELVTEKVDIIFAPTTNAAQAARQATASIPIVFAFVSDPLGSGLVASLARPGGNITGTSNVNVELAAKRLQILKETVPKTSCVAVLTSGEPQDASQLEEVQRAAKLLGMTIMITQVLSRHDFEKNNKLLRTWHANAIYVISSATNVNNRKLLAEFAAQVRLPAISAHSLYADAGGLVSYGTNQGELYRRAAHYIDKILKGAKPTDLPVEQPTKFELIINGKTAKALGIKIPNSILVRADKVIE